jgi:cytochrome c553
MKKIALAMLFAGVSLMAADGKALAGKCAACHGASFEKVALGKSAVVKGQSAGAIETSLKGYKAGTLNKNGMGALMKGQVASMSDADIKALASYIAGIK